MIVLKKYNIFTLFALLIGACAGLLQGAEGNTLSRSWASVSNFGDKILKHPATPYIAAPLALYTGYKLAGIPIEYTRRYALERTALSSLATYLGAGATVLAYYAPTFALTELMRKQRESVPASNRPSKWYLFGPALVQSLISGLLFPNNSLTPQNLAGTYKGLLATLFLSSLISPGTATGLISCLNEWSTDYEERIQADEQHIQTISSRMQQQGRIDEEREQNILRQIQELNQMEEATRGAQERRPAIDSRSGG